MSGFFDGLLVFLRWVWVALQFLWPYVREFLLFLVRLPGRIVRFLIRHREWVLTGMAMFAVMLVSAAITLRITLHVREVVVPNLQGLTVNEASEAALHTGVDLTIENRFYSRTVPAGRVLSQFPQPDSRVRHGWLVRVTESLGPQQVTIPDVVGEDLRDASLDLRRNRLDLGTQAHIAAPGDPDVVLAQTPPPNAGVDQPRVSLLLSSSAEEAASAFVMPSFVGMSFAGANRAASDQGLRVAAVWDLAKENVSVTTGPSGPVTSQYPQAGFRAIRGDAVRIYFGSIAPHTAVTPEP
jgi:beta-lactam-binding protein with PASTA domain